MDAGLTIGEVLSYIGPEVSDACWPPDVFAVAACLLQKSGCYTRLVEQWPPIAKNVEDSEERRRLAERWASRVSDLGQRWRTAAANNQDPPARIRVWWRRLTAAREKSVTDLPKNDRDNTQLRNALFQLCAAADEASVGIGLGPDSESDSAYDIQAYRLLIRKSTLAKSIDPSRLRVLPKLHTPQVGMTLRSLTHHLALAMTGDVDANWLRIPRARDGDHLHVLLLPWPLHVGPGAFSQAPGHLDNMADKFGFFTYRPPPSPIDQVREILTRGKAIVGADIDLVVLPELALGDADYAAVRRTVTVGEKAFLIAGCGTEATAVSSGKNYVMFGAPGVLPDDTDEPLPQHKHHRWKVDRSQVLQYGLGGVLSPDKHWWEYISMNEQRKVLFANIHRSLATCVLICEDLARQDPVAELVRCVGPNLVVAILMDGPQLAGRWPARYATVLAEDPGCSVLTVTSLGMVQLCQASGKPPSRNVALWKDPKSGATREIALPDRAVGVVLALAIEFEEEWTADGRSDHAQTAVVVLGGVYPIY